jgi:branched-chain amino acid transport system substrate-binding protein
MNTTVKFGLTVLAAAVLAACGKEAPKDAAKPAADAAKAAAKPEMTVKIGHVAPLTGAIAHLGKDNENGVRLAIDEANAKKIEIEGKVIKFELMGEDDQADPKVGTVVAQKLVDAKVAGIVGHLNSGTTLPASQIYNTAGIPFISGSATNPKITEQGFKVAFRVVGRDDQQGPAIASYIASEAKAKKVAIIDDATAYGQGLADEVEKTLKAAGVEIVSREKTNDKATDFKAILTKIKGKNPDAVFHGGMDATGGPMLKQARELGVRAVFSFGDGACTDEMSKLAGPAAEGLLCSQAGIPTSMADKAFVDNFTKKYGEIKQYSPFTYDAANLLIGAMQKAGSVDPAKYITALAAISQKGATGEIAFDAKGDRKDAEMTIFEMKAGKVQAIAIVKAGKTTKVGAAPAAAAPAAAAPAAAPAAAAAGDAVKAAADAAKATADAAKKP